jgi:hypothetical protein
MGQERAGGTKGERSAVTSAGADIASGSADPPSSKGDFGGRTGPKSTNSIHDDDEGPEEKTRVGVARFRATSGGAPERPLREKAEAEGGLQVSQAVRVVIWRSPDGNVHVAAKGTRVGALTVEAILVAVDGATNLGAWLTGK